MLVWFSFFLASSSKAKNPPFFSSSYFSSRQDKYRLLWKAQDAAPPVPASFEPAPDLPPISPDTIREVCGKHKIFSAVSTDGFHIRHFSWLSESNLQCLALLMQLMEISSMLPSHVKVVILHLIPKALPGLRPIGLFGGVYRAWAKIRRPLATAWETANYRPWFAAGRFMGAADTVWRQAVRSEGGVASGLSAVTLLWDFHKYYESIDLGRLLQRCACHGFPMAVARLCFSAYSCARHIVLAGYMTSACYASHGIVAGCSFATTLIRVNSLAALDQIKWPICVTYALYIDDNAVHAIGSESEVIEGLVSASQQLVIAISDGIGATLADDKGALIASNKRVGLKIQRILGEALAGPLVASAPNLGVDDTVGRPIRVKGRNAKAKAREAKAYRRCARVGKLARTVGRKARNLWCSGVLPAATYGVELAGISDSELLALRRSFASTLKPSAGDRSLSILLLLERDPTWVAQVAPICRWHKELWHAHLSSHPSVLSFRDLRSSWEWVFSKESPSWRCVSGPISAMRKSLERISWQMKDFATLIDDRGIDIPLLCLSPAVVRKLLMEAAFRVLEWSVGSKLRLPGRACFDVVHEALASKRYSPLEKGTIRAWSCGAVWTRVYARSKGYEFPEECELCGQASDTMFHRLWMCPCLDSQRREAVGDEVVDEVVEFVSHGKHRLALATRGCLAHPGDEHPLPLEDGSWDAKWALDPPPARTFGLQGNIFIDGSSSRHAIKELSRAAWCATLWSDSDELLCTMRCPVWAPLPQTPQASEFSGYWGATMSLIGPSVLITDCANVKFMHEMSRDDQTLFKRMYAGVFLQLLNRPERHLIDEVRKVKAHQSLNEEGLSQGEYALRLGNHSADLGGQRSPRFSSQGRGSSGRN